MIVLMYLYFFIILLTSSFSAATNNKVNEINANCEDGPLDIKIMKQLDIRIGGKKWDHNLNELIQSNIREAITSNPKNKPNPENDVRNGTPEEPNVVIDWTSETDPKRIINQLDSITSKLQNIQNVCQKSECMLAGVGNINVYNSDICNREVGISKPLFCEVLEENTGVKKNLAKNCREIQERGQNKSGIYEIQPKTSVKPIFVLCDMVTKGGGWTVIQKRFDGSEDFFREWRDYKFGFGNLNREFWIGLENIYQITGFQVSELLVEITDRDKIKAYANYKRFGIGPETDGYPLNILDGFSGDAGDSLKYHLASKFSTKDMDQDNHVSNCAQAYLGGWWYKDCHVSNLNGKFINMALPTAYKFKGLHWLGFRGHEYCHAGSRMLVRPVQS
ncbi:unnamed protein product [Psylliodes chrysocephalus]|uniref:Fibrinogen C-terminal domain-containing protein n=1 Tax=Psylliodes chrysocephalus TaxID=3402493 RepID=A0A9P0GG66_9CUCU|nr:unnamed protein product [Psylliodes chrysocephala]